MKRFLLLALLATTTLTFTSCIGGPSRLRRNWDTWVNQKYSEDVWVHGGLQSVLPVYPAVGVVMAAGDLFVNAWVFWNDDAWDGRGTAYEYKQPTGSVRAVTGWKNESLDGE